MRTWVRRHRWIVLWLAAVLVGSQLAASAYACPDLRSAPAVVKHAADCAGHPAASMDPAHPLLCKAHCDVDPTSVNTGSGAASVPPPVLLVDARWARVLDVADDGALAASVRPWRLPGGPPEGSPPLYLSLLVLRN